MKLYFSPGACSLSPHIVAREAGLDVELEKVDLKTKRTEAGDDYAAINPKGYVPALLLDDGALLTEGVAIVQYLADHSGNGNELIPPAGTTERYRVQEWLNYISTEIHKTFAPLFVPDLSDERKQEVKDKLATRFKTLQDTLSQQPFLLGAGFTVADAYLFTVLSWSAFTGVELPETLKGYIARVAERPQVQSALKAEGLVQ